MKYLLPSKGCNVTQVPSNVLICRIELFQNSFYHFLLLKATNWILILEMSKLIHCFVAFVFSFVFLSFIRPVVYSNYSIYDPLYIKPFHRLRLGFSHLGERKFRHNFAYIVNPLKHVILYYTLPQLCHLSHNPYE